jgi:ABC-2 type transport system ATP-binding protein
MDREISVNIKNLSKTFHLLEDKKFTLKSLVASFFNQGKKHKFKALSNINLEIYKGEFFGIAGNNGSGKSTLLKLIAGIFEGDEGSQVEYAGRLVPFLELGVGFNPELTGKENIFLNGTILGMSIKFLKSKFNEIVEFAEIGPYINMPVKNYSSGMQIRLAFSIAIQSNADIYLLDEVFGVGDHKFQKKSLSKIIELKKSGKTAIIVSHSRSIFETYCDRMCVLENGTIKYIGEPKSICTSYFG